MVWSFIEFGIPDSYNADPEAVAELSDRSLISVVKVKSGGTYNINIYVSQDAGSSSSSCSSSSSSTSTTSSTTTTSSSSSIPV